MTNPTTEIPSQLLFKEISERLSSDAVLVPKLCPEAFAKLNNGDLHGHDEEVVNVARQLLSEVDLVMLAQISIARVRTNLDDTLSDRVLSSIDFISEKITEVLGNQ